METNFVRRWKVYQRPILRDSSPELLASPPCRCQACLATLPVVYGGESIENQTSSGYLVHKSLFPKGMLSLKVIELVFHQGNYGLPLSHFWTGLPRATRQYTGRERKQYYKQGDWTRDNQIDFGGSERAESSFEEGEGLGHGLGGPEIVELGLNQESHLPKRRSCRPAIDTIV
jgi:hypothetical protein